MSVAIEDMDVVEYHESTGWCPSDEWEDDNDEPHTGHFTMWGGWFCDTCNSPYCDLA